MATKIDLSTDSYTAAFAAAPIYRKKGLVTARDAEAGERITTTLADGTKETTSRAAVAGDKVITNPGGEEYLIGGDKFATRYEPTDVPGQFRASGRIRAIPNTTGEEVEITAPWGEVQVGGPNCVFATAVETDGSPTADRYIIGRAEFTATYGIETPTGAQDTLGSEAVGRSL